MRVESNTSQVLNAELEVADAASIEAADLETISPRAGSGPTRKMLDLVASRYDECAATCSLLRNNEAAWQARLRLIHRAKEVLSITQFYAQPDEKGHAFLDALIEAQQRGVQIFVSFDGQAQFFTSRWEDRTQRDAFYDKIRTLIKNGAWIGTYGSLLKYIEKPGTGMHMKSIVADGNRAIAGGRNVSNMYFGDHFSDFDFEMLGAVAANLGSENMDVLKNCRPLRARGIRQKEMRSRLDALYPKWAGYFRMKDKVWDRVPVADGTPRMRLVAHQPLDSNGRFKHGKNPITETLKAAFASAKREIWATSNYINASEELKDALVDAAKRGVAVHLLTGGEKTNISPFPYRISEQNYKRFLAAGITIHETVVHQEHAKIFTIDGGLCAAGSYNLDKRADERFVEQLVFSNDPRMVASLKGIIQEAIAENCTTVDADTIQKNNRGFFVRVGHFFQSLIAKLLEKMM